MTDKVVYRCNGCGAEFEVTSETNPTVICPDCDVPADPQDDGRAIADYRVGYAHYREGRRQLAAALTEFDQSNWIHARALFDGASNDFEAAVDKFRQSASRTETPSLTDLTETARQKSTCYWQVVDWLSGTAYAHENTDTEQAEHYQTEAEKQLRRASKLDDLQDPDALTADHDDASNGPDTATSATTTPDNSSEQVADGSGSERA